MSIFKKLDIEFFESGKFGFFEQLVKHNSLELLDLGDVVYPCLVRLFYANLEKKWVLIDVYVGEK